MKKHNVQNIDPAEICGCNPEWSSSSEGNDWDEGRCSVIVPVDSDSDHKRKDA